jgi:hypothetical protein
MREPQRCQRERVAAVRRQELDHTPMPPMPLPLA